MERYIDPNMISVPYGYLVEAFKTNLNVPTDFKILETGDIYYGDSGITDGNGKLIKITKNSIQIIADGFEAPLTGITYYKGNFYVSHLGSITMVTKTGKKTDLLVGLPSYGDHHNNRVAFGKDEKMNFGQGTATNSGVVGLDNNWVKSHPHFRDFPAKPVKVNGHIFKTKINIDFKNKIILTGAFAPFGTLTYFNEEIKKFFLEAVAY